jgi:hypothetical protein
VVKAVWSWISSNWPLLLAILTGPFGIAVLLITRNFDKIKDAAQSVYNFIKGIFDKIAAAIGKVTSLIKNIPKPSIPDLNPFGAAAPAAPATAALAGRSFAGVARAPASRSAGTAGVVINVNGALDPEGVARQLRRILGSHEVRVGRAAVGAI